LFPLPTPTLARARVDADVAIPASTRDGPRRPRAGSARHGCCGRRGAPPAPPSARRARGRAGRPAPIAPIGDARRVLGATPPPPLPPPPRQRRVGADGPPGPLSDGWALHRPPPPRWARLVRHDPLHGVRACARQHHRPPEGWRRDRRGPASPTSTIRDGDPLISAPPPRVGASREPPRPMHRVPRGVPAHGRSRRGRLDNNAQIGLWPMRSDTCLTLDAQGVQRLPDRSGHGRLLQSTPPCPSAHEMTSTEPPCGEPYPPHPPPSPTTGT